MARFSGLPQAADVETVSVKVTASDGNGGSVSDTFDIVVSADTTVNCAGMCLVSNVGQTSENVQGFGDTDFAQSFTTGTNATGYTLTSIELKLSSSRRCYHSYGEALQGVRKRNGSGHVDRPDNVG